MKEQLTQSRLKELLHYDPETGIFTRLISAGPSNAGAIVGTPSTSRHLQTMLCGVRYYNHRLAWLYMTGAWPEHQIDHINGVRNDNRWINLREVSPSENNHNLGGVPCHNISGFLGASWHKHSGSWQATIKLGGVTTHLGYHSTPEAAHAAYLKAKDELHPTHRRLRSEA